MNEDLDTKWVEMVPLDAVPPGQAMKIWDHASLV